MDVPVIIYQMDGLIPSPLYIMHKEMVNTSSYNDPHSGQSGNGGRCQMEEMVSHVMKKYFCQSSKL